MQTERQRLNLLMAGLTALYLLILATRPSEYFFGPTSWQWHGRPPAVGTFARWWPALLLLAIYFAGVSLGDRHLVQQSSRRQEWIALLFLLLLAPAIQVALKYIHYRFPVEFYLHRTIGPHNGFWQIAIGTDNLDNFLRNFPEQMQTHPFVHTTTHPPGNFVYIWLWRKLFTLWPEAAGHVSQLFRSYNCADLQFVSLNDPQISAALGQMAIPFLSGLVGIPLYFFGKRLGGARVGLRSSALFLTVPSFTLFTIRWDQLYPIFWVAATYLFYRALETRRLFWFFFSGLTVSVASFMSFGNLAILLLLGGYGLIHLISRGLGKWKAWVRNFWFGGLVFTLGTFTVWLAYRLVYGVSFWDVFTISMETHLYLGRSYLVWLGYNLYDFLTFMGVPVAVLVTVATIRTGKNALRAFRSGRDELPSAVIPILGLVVALLLLDLSGVTLGEVGRIWLPWMALACIVAALWLKRNTVSFPLVLALMLVQALFFSLFLRVSSTGMPRFTPRSPQFAMTSAAHPLGAELGESARLAGYEVTPDVVEAGELLQVTLHWQAREQTDRPYTIFTHLVDETGQLKAQEDSMPQQNELPTTCWQAGEYVTDPHTILVPEDLAPGTYTVQTGMYYLPTGQRLPVSRMVAGSLESADYVRLTEVEVVAP